MINTQEDLDPLMVDVKDTIHNREQVYTGEEIVKRRSKQPLARMTFTKRFSALISVTTRAFSGKPKLFIYHCAVEYTLYLFCLILRLYRIF